MSNVRPQFTRPANRPGALSSFTLTLPQPSNKRSFNIVENGFLSQLPSICFCCESAARLCRKENKFNTDHPLCYVSGRSGQEKARPNFLAGTGGVRGVAHHCTLGMQSAITNLWGASWSSVLFHLLWSFCSGGRAKNGARRSHEPDRYSPGFPPHLMRVPKGTLSGAHPGPLSFRCGNRAGSESTPS